MPQFKPNQPVEQPDAQVKVEVSRANPLPVGANRFRLVVIDDEGNESEAKDIEIIVQATQVPTAVIEMTDDNGQRVDPVVEFGKAFVLSAAKSSDIAPGKIVTYRFTLLPRP